ncbi:MAG: FHA domain-containing protein [Enterocloster sp.]
MSKIEIVLQGRGKEKAGRQRKSITVTEGRSGEKKKRVNWKGDEIKQEGSGRTEPEWKGATLRRQFILWLSAAVLCPSALWMFKGMTMVIDNWRLLAAIDGGLLFMLSAMNLYRLFIGHRAAKADGAGSDDEQDPWRILYEDEDDEDEDLGNQPSTAYMNGDKNEYLQKMPESSAGECFQTVLLSERPAQGEEVRRLSALNGSDEDIVISYYPFVIGKHKDLADYVLLKDTVSRFHIRLDEDNGSYTVTDLNSTNGTRVRGRLLEANETTQLEPGDQIFIADCGYIFD